MPEPIQPMPNTVAPPPKKKGKGLVIAIVAVIVLGLLAAAGTWYFMNKKINDQKSQSQQQIDELNKRVQELQQQPQAASTPTESQKTLTTQYEKLIVTYPSSLTASNTSKAINQNGIVGTDTVNLTSSNGFKIAILTGVYGVGGACPYCKVLKSELMTILGQNVYLNYVSFDGGPKVDYIVVAKSPEDSFGVGLQGKNVTVDDGNKTLIDVRASYPKGDSFVAKSLDELKTDPNIANLKQILQNLKY